MKVKKKQSYITVLDWMVEKYHLHGNDLLTYALIYGFSQDGDSEYKGSFAYICKWLEVDRGTAIRIINRLISRGLVSKRQELVNGKATNRYVAEMPDAAESKSSQKMAEVENAKPDKVRREPIPHPPDQWQNATSGKTPPVAKRHSDQWQNATPTSGETPPKYTNREYYRDIYLSNTADAGSMDATPAGDDLETRFREQLEMEILARRYDRAELDELLANIVDMYRCPYQFQSIGKKLQSTKGVRMTLDKLTSKHIEYIIDSLANTTQPVKNIQAYLRTTILNAPTTMEHYYQAQGNAACAHSGHPAGPSMPGLDASIRRIRAK